MKPSPRRWLAATLSDWAVIAAAMAAGVWAAHPLVWFAVVFVVGTRQHALGLMFHDATHRLAHPNWWANDALGKLLCGWPLGVNLDSYRKFHFAHHRTVGTPDDPELLHFHVWSKGHFEPPKTVWGFARRFVADLLGFGVVEVFRISKMIGKPELGRFAVWGVGGGLLVYFGLWQVAAAWVAASLTSFVAVFRLRVWSEHVGTTGTWRFRPGLLGRFVVWPHNTWCHAEHHDDPDVPFWALPARRGQSPVPSAAGLFRGFAPEK